jgi:GNAT acetyltransferase-like protein
MNSDDTEIKIKSACEVKEHELIKFFEKFYPNRAKFLSKNWFWLNRSDFLNKQTPLVVIDHENVIGQAATIPLKIKIDGKTYSSGWFIDLIVDPKYRGKGIATKLEKNNMNYFEVCLGFPNEKSKPLLEKVGWKESPHSYMHYHLLNPFSTQLIPKFVPKFIRNILNYFYKIIPVITYSQYSADRADILLETITEKSNAKFKSLVSYDKNSAVPLRDDEYYNWRVINSPNVNKYRIVFLKNDPNISCIVKLDQRKENSFIDIMWISDLNRKKSILALVSSLALWALRNKYSYMRMYTSNSDLTEFIKKSLKIKIKTPPFIFFTNKPELLALSEKIIWNVDMFDSDFEWQV